MTQKRAPSLPAGGNFGPPHPDPDQPVEMRPLAPDRHVLLKPLSLLPFLVDELPGRVGPGKWNIGDLDPQKFTEWPPAVAHIEYQETVGGDFGLNIGNMILEHLRGVLSFGQAAMEDLRSDRLVAHLTDRIHMWRRMGPARCEKWGNGGLHAVKPIIGIAHR